MKPRYPIYVVSKGRWENPLTARFLAADRVPFKVVVEPQELDAYARVVGADNVLALPFSNLGLGSIPARNWIWEHAKAAGYARHWVLDDNIRSVRRAWKGHRILCDSGPAFACVEDFSDRYENVAISGLAYAMFYMGNSLPPFRSNCHLYSCLLILNDMPYRWRGRYNEDTDLCLQVLSMGWCTIQFNAFLIDKVKTMTMKGGNTDSLYDGDGRLKMARSLQRAWPRVVETKRKFNRPQHHVRGHWMKFDTPLKLRAGVDRAALAVLNEYGLELKQVVETVKSPRIAGLLAQVKAERGS